MAPLIASRGNSSVRVPGREADGEQPGRAVDEGGDEDAEHDLGRPVAEEVAQQPGRELGRGQLQRDDGQAEHQGDDRDDGAADRDQQRAGVVGRALEGEPVQRRARADLRPGTWRTRRRARAGRPGWAAPRARRCGVLAQVLPAQRPPRAPRRTRTASGRSADHGDGQAIVADRERRRSSYASRSTHRSRDYPAPMAYYRSVGEIPPKRHTAVPAAGRQSVRRGADG